MAQQSLAEVGEQSVTDVQLQVGQPENGNLAEVKASSEGEAGSDKAASRRRDGKRRRNRTAGRNKNP
jgi:hypothetical protein